MKMKKVFNCLVVVLFAALSVVSCLPDSDYSHSSVVTADFEYLFVDFDADSLFYKSEKGSGIGWGSLGFMHKIDTVNWKFEGGLLLSRQKGTRYDSADKVALSKEESEVFAKDRFRVNSVKDSLNDNSYLVFYQNPDSSKMPEHDVVFLAPDYGTCQAKVCFVNNTSYVAYKVAQTFEPGDRLTLTATGYLNGVKTGDASLLLADFSTQKDSIVSTWTAFDLSKLKVYDAIDFNVESTKGDVPGYFCMDYFSAHVTISSGI